MKRERENGKSMIQASAAGNMCEKTARKYLASKLLPSEQRKPRNYRTRMDPFSDIWPEIRELLQENPGLQAKSILEHFQKSQPDKFQSSQLRTLQRKIKLWKAQEGPEKEVFFPQKHEPGNLGQSDFTSMDDLSITINRLPFRHIFYHFVLTYSNWETGSICYSESFEALSEGLQNALWALGGSPLQHRTDRLSAAVNNQCNAREFSQRYQELLQHYGVIGQKTNPSSPNENGDIEQSHYRLKTAIDQALMLRGSRDFSSVKEYESFLDQTMESRNRGRMEKVLEEKKLLKPLPARRLNVFKRFRARVSKNSLLQISHNHYSVPSRLIGEWVMIQQYADRIEVYCGDLKVDEMPRLRGESRNYIKYQHVIYSLRKKPGAFENYKYRSFMFPTSNFRLVYDILKEQKPAQYIKEYIEILVLATEEGEELVEGFLVSFIDSGREISSVELRCLIETGEKTSSRFDISVDEPGLSEYDELIQEVF